MTQHTFQLSRASSNNLSVSETREWLVTNGTGSFAAGTVAGVLSRRYHGLLLVALHPPLGRTLLVTKFDDTATYNQHTYPLYANRWGTYVVNPAGYLNLNSFHLEGTTPVWTYACADALLEKRIWMEQGANTTYVHYTLPRATLPLTLNAKILVNYRNYHGDTRANGWRMHIEHMYHGFKVVAYEGATPFYIYGRMADITATHDWYQDFYLSTEAYRGLDSYEDHLYIGDFQATLQPGQSITFVASTDTAPELDGAPAYKRQQAYEQTLVTSANTTPLAPELHNPLVRHLLLAADQFIVKRPTAEHPTGQTIIAGYPWFGDWGRDTMISLPGLTLATGRPEVARQILRTFARFVDQGMLPNRFPDAGEVPAYNTVDATLWYVEAIRAYYATTQDKPLLEELFPVLEDIIQWHHQGTRYNIHVDTSDGLLYAGQDGVQLTWMDAKVGDWVVTPRLGKPIEINALWYNALLTMADFAHILGQPADAYRTAAATAKAGFARFWNPDVGYCFDVLEGPDPDDDSLRPNQLLAVSLPQSPFDAATQKAIVDVCARHLLTPHGLRSLAPDHPAYVKKYGGEIHERDGAYHQGTVWGWLLGPFVLAHLRVYNNPSLARSFLEPLLLSLHDGVTGSLSEIFDGDAPFTARGCPAQAWTVAELLRAWVATQESTWQ